MSEYLQIYAKSKNNEFVELDCVGRSNYIYSAFDVPYGKVKLFTRSDIIEIQNKIREDKKDVENRIKLNKDKIEQIKSFNNSAEEKLEMMSQYDVIIEEEEEYLKEIIYADYYTSFLISIIETNKYSDDSREDVLYIGKEVGNNITMEDVEVCPKDILR